MSSGRKYSRLLALACIAASAPIFAAPPTIPQAISLTGNRLVSDQTGAGGWPGEDDFIGPSIAGEASAFLVTGNLSYKNATLAGGTDILTTQGYYLPSSPSNPPPDFLGDEAWGLAMASQLSLSPTNNDYRSALTTFYNTTVPGGDGGTLGFTNRLVSDYTSMFGDQSEAVLYLAEHTAAANYVNSSQTPIWRTALINALAQIDDTDYTPVQATGVALWALAQTGPLNSTIISNSTTSYFYNTPLSALAGIVSSRQITSGSQSGAFYVNLVSNSLKDQTEDASYALLGLAAANSTLYSAQIISGKTWLASADSSTTGMYADNPYTPHTTDYFIGGEALQALTASQTVTWTASSGNWSGGSNWNINPQVPINGSPAAGAYYDVLVPSGAITLDEDVAIRTLTFTSGSITGSHNFTVSGGTINGTYAITGTTTILAGTLMMGGTTQNTGKFAGNGNLQINPGTTLTSDGITTWGLVVNGNSIIRVSDTINGTSAVSALSIAGAPTSAGGWTGKLDLNNNALILLNNSSTAKNSLIPTLNDQIASGKNGGLWNGAGITSSTVATNANTTIALVDNAELGATTYRGQTVDSNSIIIQQALLGDVDLSGAVGFGDLLKIAQDYGQPGGWAKGNMDGKNGVDFADLLMVAQHYGQTLPILPDDAPAAAPVPEPASLGILALGGALLLRRRDKRRSGTIR